MSEFEKTNQQEVSTVNKRRSFLKKTATGAVVFSLPAKSVWGTCTVSGAMSGNLSGNLSANHNHPECAMPPLHGGRSPGYWKRCLERDNLHAVFSHLKSAKNSLGGHPSTSQLSAFNATKGCYRNAVSGAMSHELLLDSALNPLSYTVGGALGSHGQTPNNIYYHLGAVYLNAYFGVYTSYSGGSVAAARQAIEDVYLYWYMGIKTNNTVSITNDMLGYTNGTTTFQPMGC